MRLAYAKKKKEDTLPKAKIAAQRKPWAKACKENKGLSQMIAKKEAKVKEQAAGIQTGEESISTKQKNHAQAAGAFKIFGFPGDHFREYKSFADELLDPLRNEPFQQRGVDRLEWRES